jgi:hypothetical protein
MEARMSKERIAELFSWEPKSIQPQRVANVEIPSQFEHPPAVVLYGERAFHLVLRCSEQFSHYMEVECWRAPDPEREKSLATHV